MKLTKVILQKLIQEEMETDMPELSVGGTPGTEKGGDKPSLEDVYEGEAEFNPSTLLHSYFVHAEHGGRFKAHLIMLPHKSPRELMEDLCCWWSKSGEFRQNTKDLIGRVAFAKLREVLSHCICTHDPDKTIGTEYAATFGEKPSSADPGSDAAND